MSVTHLHYAHEIELLFVCGFLVSSVGRWFKDASSILYFEIEGSDPLEGAGRTYTHASFLSKDCFYCSKNITVQFWDFYIDPFSSYCDLNLLITLESEPLVSKWEKIMLLLCVIENRNAKRHKLWVCKQKCIGTCSSSFSHSG